MAFELSRIDRLTRTIDLAAKFPGRTPITAAQVALLAPRSTPNASTVWYTATVASNTATVLFAGPDADPTGAVVVSGSADLWVKITAAVEVDAAKVERITVLGGGSVPIVPLDRGLPAGGTTGQVLTKASSNAYDAEWDDPTGGGGGGAVASVNGHIGAVVLGASDVGAQPVGDYATNTALTNGLANKVNTSTYTTGLAAKADTASLAAVAQTGSYTDLANKPTLGTAAAQNTTAFDAAGAAAAAQAAAVQRANHTGTQAAATITGLATVATSGGYNDLSGKPTIPTPASLVADSTVLSTLVPRTQQTSRIAFFGDSITGYLYQYPIVAQALSLGRVQVTGLYSHSGFSSGQLVPLVTEFTQATPKPGKVVILCGTNDAQGTLVGATFRANLLAIAQAALNAGIEPILCTIPPLGSQFAAAKRNNVAAINAQVKILASSLNLQVIDFHAVTTDPATGQYLSGMDSGDGIHPAYAGQLAMAQATVSTIQPSTPPGGLPLVDFNTDAANLFTNPLALTDANADGVPDGWDAFNTATGLAYSTATDAAIKGKWATVTATASSTQSQIQNRRVGGFTAGDTIYFACLVKTSGLNASGGFAVYVIWYLDFGGTVVRSDLLGAGGPVGSGPGLYTGTFVAPATATQVSIQLQPTASTGVYQIGQVTGYNETALGIA